MKAKDTEENYRPIKFALNRAVFHKELTTEEADKGIAEYEALNKVAELAPKVSNDWDDNYEAMQAALKILSALRK